MIVSIITGLAVKDRVHRGGEITPPFLLIEKVVFLMNQLNIFIDESGDFGHYEAFN